MTTKTYTVTMFRVSKAASQSGTGRDVWTCQATSLQDAVAQFAQSGADRDYMAAAVAVEGGKRSYRVEQVDGYWAAAREAFKARNAKK